MKNALRFFIGISLLVLIACWGCGENSEAEMKQAEQAMEQAKSLFAEDLAPTNWVDAMKAWEQGQAAVKQGKPAKTYFIRAKSRFEKTATIAQAQGENLSKEVTSIQLAIGERIAKVRAALDRGKVSPKIQKQVKPLAAEVEEGMATIESLAGQKNFLKARTLAREMQTKAYNAELMLAGKKPVS
jgi:hypothetical protein